ncbi:caspase family protein [Patescibacteria group bacterium]|nr:caspase family protein [Patescibacteria group bacterium]
MRQNTWLWLITISLTVLSLAIWSDRQTVSRGRGRTDRIGYSPSRVCTGGNDGNACIYGVFVGIETYERNWLHRLSGGDEGMVELYKAFVNRRLMRSEDGIVLTNERATDREIRDAFVALSRRMRPQDIFVFSFTGHGYTELLSTYSADVDVTARHLQNLLQTIPARTLFVDLDTCMSASFDRSMRSLSSKKQVVAVFSSRATEDAVDPILDGFKGPRGNHVTRPRIAYYLYRAVHELGGINGIVTVSTLTTFLRARYAEGDAERRHGQHLVITGPDDIVLWRAHPWNRTRH